MIRKGQRWAEVSSAEVVTVVYVGHSKHGRQHDLIAYRHDDGREFGVGRSDFLRLFSHLKKDRGEALAGREQIRALDAMIAARPDFYVRRLV